jgi:hypothetical protein
MQYQVISQPLDPDTDAAETHRCFEARDLLTHGPFDTQGSAGNAELGAWSIAGQPLSCEDFDEDD